MANELTVQKQVAKEAVTVFKALGPNQQAAVFIAGILAVAGVCTLVPRWAMEMGYEIKWDKNGVRLFKPEAVNALPVAS